MDHIDPNSVLNHEPRPISLLPPAAAAKFRGFTDDFRAAQAAADAARERLDALSRPLGALRTAVADAERRDVAPNPDTLAELSRLTREEEHRLETLRRHQADATRLAPIINGVERWLGSLPAGAVIADATAPEVKKGATLQLLRADIEALVSDIEALAAAPPTRSEQEATLKAEIARLGTAGRPVLRRGGGLKVTPGVSPLAVACWLDPEAVFARLAEEGAIREGGTLSAQEKAAQLADLRTRLLKAERVEEALVVKEGGTRRRDADPRAVLGVEVQ